MAKFRKKPVVIEAWQFNGYASLDAAPDWMTEARRVYGGLTDPGMWRAEPDPITDAECLTIHTLEGAHRANVGDFIIKGVKGELYPCKPDIFAMTYEPAE